MPLICNLISLYDEVGTQTHTSFIQGCSGSSTCLSTAHLVQGILKLYDKVLSESRSSRFFHYTTQLPCFYHLFSEKRLCKT